MITLSIGQVTAQPLGVCSHCGHCSNGQSFVEAFRWLLHQPLLASDAFELLQTSKVLESALGDYSKARLAAFERHGKQSVDGGNWHVEPGEPTTALIAELQPLHERTLTTTLKEKIVLPSSCAVSAETLRMLSELVSHKPTKERHNEV
jgi:hypothetical protein